MLINSGADVTKVENTGRTALMLAEENGHSTVARLLRQCGTRKTQQCGKHLPRVLVKTSADVDWASATDGKTALMILAQTNHDAAMRVLIKAGADVNKAVQNHGWTALMLAAECGRDKSVRLLVEAGADMNKIGKKSRTALLLAEENNHATVATVLRDSGAMDVYSHQHKSEDVFTPTITSQNRRSTRSAGQQDLPSFDATTPLICGWGNMVSPVAKHYF